MYIDILFLTELINDIYVLIITKAVLKVHIKRKRILSAALCGALFTTVWMLLFRQKQIVTFLMSILLCILMLYIAFYPRSYSAFIKGFFSMYTAAFLMKGIIHILSGFFSELPLFFLMFICFIFLNIIIHIYRLVTMNNEQYCIIRMNFNGEVKSFKALIDTGNKLTDKNGTPVSVIEEAAVSNWLIDLQLSDIAFSSIGCKYGKMKIFYVPYLFIIHMNNEKLLENVPVCICENCLSEKNNYQIIISPSLFDL